MATITLDGRPTNDGDLRFTPAGKPVFEFTLAENHRKKDPSGQWIDDGASFYRVTVWGQTAETLAEASIKGRPMLIDGRVKVREYETRDGTKGKSVDVTAERVAFIPTRQQAQGGGYGHNTPGPVPEDPWATTGAQTGAQGADNEPPF